MSAAALAGRRIAAIGSFDSFLKTGQVLLSACAGAGAQVETVIVPVPGKEPSTHQLAALGLERAASLPDLGAVIGSDRFRQWDALMLMLDGRSIREFLLRLHLQQELADGVPILVAAYPGLVFREHLNGFLDRAAVDLLCFNGDLDRGLYERAAQGLGIDASNACTTGLPLLWPLRPRPVAVDGAVVFFEQPSVPATDLQRLFLARELVAMATRLWPRRVILKPRTRVQDSTLHPARGHLERLIERVVGPGQRLPIVSHAPALTLLEDCRLALTVSSTAALEAIALGVPTRIVADFGVNETLGNAYFAEAGLFTMLSAVRGDEATGPVTGWLEARAAPAGGPEAFVDRLAALTAARDPRRRPVSCRPLVPALGSGAWLDYALNEAGVLGASAARSPQRHGLRSRLRRVPALRRTYRWFKRVLA